MDAGSKQCCSNHADDFLGKLEEQYGKTEVEALLKGRGRQNPDLDDILSGY